LFTGRIALDLDLDAARGVKKGSEAFLIHISLNSGLVLRVR